MLIKNVLNWALPKKPNNTKDVNSRINAQENQLEIKGVLIFWILRSVHLELRNVLPRRAKVDLNLLFLSKNTRKYDRKLELYLGLLV
jgi:hypothetical protein